MILKPRPISTRQFDYLTADRTFVGEISSTHGFGQVYDDACDEGLTLVNPTTGREVVFVVHHTEVRDGEVIGWILRPAIASEAIGVTISLAND